MSFLSLISSNGAENLQARSGATGLTPKIQAGYKLNERQMQAVAHVKRVGQISNSEYQELMGVAKRTAHRDLADLVENGLFVKVGTRGKGTYYKLQRKGP